MTISEGSIIVVIEILDSPETDLTVVRREIAAFKFAVTLDVVVSGGDGSGNEVQAITYHANLVADTANATDTKKKKKLKDADFAGIAVGGFFFISFIVLSVIYVIKSRRQQDGYTPVV